MVILMALSQKTDDVINQMLRIDQLLRKTSPQHRLGEEEKRLVLESISKAEEGLRAMMDEVAKG